MAPHQAGVRVRRGGFASHRDNGRALLDDLYGDPKIVKILARNGVVVPGEEPGRAVRVPRPAAPCDRARDGAVRGCRAADSSHEPSNEPSHGVGQGAVRSGLKVAGLDLRPEGQDAPWTIRRGSG